MFAIVRYLKSYHLKKIVYTLNPPPPRRTQLLKWGPSAIVKKMYPGFVSAISLRADTNDTLTDWIFLLILCLQEHPEIWNWVTIKKTIRTHGQR